MNNVTNNVQTVTVNGQPEFQKNNNKMITKEIYEEPNRFLKKENNTNRVQSKVEKLNEVLAYEKTNLKFVFHEELHEYYVTVVNPNTNEVVREIPPKKILDIYAAMKELVGILVDEKR